MNALWAANFGVANRGVFQPRSPKIPSISSSPVFCNRLELDLD